MGSARFRLRSCGALRTYRLVARDAYIKGASTIGAAQPRKSPETLLFHSCWGQIRHFEGLDIYVRRKPATPHPSYHHVKALLQFPAQYPYTLNRHPSCNLLLNAPSPSPSSPPPFACACPTAPLRQASNPPAQHPSLRPPSGSPASA